MVVVAPSGTAGVDSGPTLDPAGPVTAGPVGAGLVASTGLDPSGVSDAPGTGVEVAVHLLQIVDVDVKVTVETVCEVVTKVEEPEVTVLVTGQVVTVSQVTTVVVRSPGAVAVPTGEDGAGDEAPEVTPGAKGVLVGTEPPEVAPGGGDPAEEPTGKTPVGVGTAGREGEPVAAGAVSVTGHTVVETAMVEVTTVVESAGQFTTVEAQRVIVTSLVVYTVEVVNRTGLVTTGVEGLGVSVGASPPEEGSTEVEGTPEPLGGDDAAGELTGRTPVGVGTGGKDGEPVAAGAVSVTGQTVVETAIVEVTTVVEPDPAGQSVTLAAQLVIVILLVVYTVEVVMRTGVLTAGVVTGATEEPGTETEGKTTTTELELPVSDAWGTEVAATVVPGTGAVAVEPGVQSKPTL
jgi:hypothetical protein